MLSKKCLNGLWDFSYMSDSIDVLPEKWDSVKIKVPSPFNVNSFAGGYDRNIAGEDYYVSGADFRIYPEYPLEWDTAQVGFYRRSFFVGEESRGKRLFLHFDAVAYKSAYYLNGKCIAHESEAFLPIETEITESVKYGKENELIVACQTASSAVYKDENGRDRTDFPEGSFWGGHIGGIWQDCYLIERADSYIEDIFAYADVYKNKLHIEYSPVNGENMQVRFSLSRWGAEDYREMFTCRCTGEAIDWDYSDWDIALWEPESPNLYTLKAEIIRDGEILDSHVIRIGFRTFHIKDKGFMLNGRPIKLRNDSWHYMGYAVQSEEYARAYFKMAKEANVNIIRLHAMPYPSFFFDIADEVGMLMVSESATWASHCRFSYNDDFFENAKKHLRRLIVRDRNHPSVVMWSPENECIPAYKVAGSKYIKDLDDLSEKVYDMTLEIPKLDPSRPYSCDGSHDLGGRLDVNSLHYPGYDCPTHREKPITIGENGSMYYSSTDTVCMVQGEKTHRSFDGRLNAIGQECYHNLIGQRKWAAQVCVFNLIWYGLEPLPFKDKILTYEDYETPGIKPSRITPYLRTLNAGAQKDLPEYIPNPVWKYAQKAFIPVRPFLENTPTGVWSGEYTEFPVCVFNDNRDPLNLTLTGVITVDGCEKARVSKKLYMEACTYEDTSLTLEMPFAEYSEKAEIRVTLSDASGDYYTDSAYITIFNREALNGHWEKVKVTCLKNGDGDVEGDLALDFRQGSSSPYGAFMRRRKVKEIFTSDTLADELRFNGEDIVLGGKREACYFEDYLNFNASPIYFNGAGMPLALDLTVAGKPVIVCSVDLAQYMHQEPFALVMMIKMAEYLRNRNAVSSKQAYFYGDGNSAVAAMLDAVRCNYKPVDDKELKELLKSSDQPLLIADGAEDLSWLKGVCSSNFKNVLIFNVTKAPKLFYYDFAVSDKSAYCLVPVNNDNAISGVYSNNLYSLSQGNQAALSVNMLEYKGENSNILLGLPKVDWRQWNDSAEFLKTVAVYKDELENCGRFSALSCHRYAGSKIYFAQIPMQLQNKKIKHLIVRMLSAFNIRVEAAKSADLDDLLTSGIYSSRLNRALCRKITPDEDITALNPGLNVIESGECWRAVSAEDNTPDSYAMAVFVYSPSDRTDLLRNPDTVELQVNTEMGCELLLGGKKIGQGENIKINSITLNSGWNTLVFICRRGGEMPHVKFTRYDLSKLDLIFSLYCHDIQHIGLIGAKFSSENQPNNTEKAAAGPQEHWRCEGDQRDGIDFGICLNKPALCRGIYFSSMTSDIAGDCYTPHSFEILAGNEEGDLRKIYESLFEERMSFRGGKVFVDLGEGVRASRFKIILKSNALKSFIISDLALLS